MKNLVSFLLSYCLVITSLSIPLNTFAQTAGSFNPNIQSECPTGGNSAWTWDASRNRCVMKASASEGREDFQKCQDEDYLRSNHDLPTGNDTAAYTAAQRRCLEANRNDMIGEDMTDADTSLWDNGNWLSTLAATASGVYLAIHIISGVGKNGEGQCTSRKIFKYAAIAGVAADLYFKIFGGKKFKEIEEEYAAQINETEGDENGDGQDAYSLQISAFEFLADQQAEVKRIANQQATVYTILTLGYLAAGILATVESTVGMTTGAPTPCVVDKTVTETQTVTHTIETDPIQITKIVDSVAPAAGNMLSTSVGIAILSGILMTLYGLLASFAKKEAKDAENRITIINRVKDQFNEMYNSAGFCPSRDDLSNPACYCFTDKGERNSDRSNSQTCQNIWAAQDKQLFAAANNAEFQQGVKPPRVGCVTITQKFDPECKCRKMKSSDGGNACYQQAIPTQEFGQFAPGSILTDPLRQIANITNGGIGSGDISGTGSNVQNAAKRLFKQGLDKMDKDLKKKGEPTSRNIAKGFMNGVNKAVQKAQGLQGGNLSLLAGSNASTPSKLAPVIDKQFANNPNLKKAFKGKRIAARIKGKRAGKRKMFEFNESAANAPKVVGDYMEKEYDYSKAQDDIVDRSDVSIWKILSNRYTRTGLERLFGGDKKSGQGL